MTRPILLLALVAMVPTAAWAETAAVAVGASEELDGLEELTAGLASRLESAGYDVMPADVVQAALDGPLTAEQSQGELERLAAALEASLVLVVFVAVEPQGMTVRASAFDVGAAATLTASTTVGAADPMATAEALATRLVGQASSPRASAAAAEQLSAESTETSPPPTPNPEPIEEAPAPPPPPQPPPTRSRDGRVQLILNATALGLYLMSGVLFAANVTDPRLFAPILLLGGGGGLAVSLTVLRRWEISPGDNSVVGLGGWWGGATGILIAGASGYGDVRWIMTGGLVGQALGLAASIAAAAHTEVSAGDGAVIHSGAVWGLFGGGVLATLVGHDDLRASYGMILAGLYAGLGAGALSAHLTEISAGRAAIIDLCGLLGVLLGASVGTPIIIDSQSAGHLRAYAGVLLGAAAVGLGIGALVTRRWDNDRDDESDQGASAHGRRFAGVPVPVPYIISPAVGLPDSRPGIGLQLVGGAL